MQNDIIENAAVELILQHSLEYEIRFNQLDQAIALYQDGSQNEILAVLMTIRKSINALFKLAVKYGNDQSKESSEQLHSTLNEIVVANMQLRSYNNLFNGNSEIINEICDFQCWLANAAVLLTIDLGGE